MAPVLEGFLALVAMCALVVVVLLCKAAPRATFVVWCAVLFFVPVWVGISVGPFWSAITLITLLAIVSCGGDVELTAADGVMAVLVVLILAQYALGLTSLSAAFSAIGDWVIPFVWGRMALVRLRTGFITESLALFATAAALAAVIEFVTTTNVFVSIPPGSASLYQTWGTLQPRGGEIRAEGAFGHAIALGGALAMSSAFVLSVRWPALVRLLALAAIVAGTVFTFSRIGLITLVITIALGVLVIPGLARAARVGIGIAGGVAALIVVPFVSEVFLDAGQEATGSADYRFDLLALFHVIQPLGSAPDIEGLTVGGSYLGVYDKSVDNALVVVALRVGWAPMLLLVVLLVLAVLPVFRRGAANPASVAAIGQLPGIFAVAFITQYGMFLFFVVGLAIAWEAEARRSRSALPSFAVPKPRAALIGWQGGRSGRVDTTESVSSASGLYDGGLGK